MTRDPFNRSGTDYDPEHDAPGMAEHADQVREQTELLTEFENFRETKIYKLLCEQAVADEDEAIEALIAKDATTDTERQRAIIQRCRYFNTWALSLTETLNQARTNTDPP